MPARWLSLLAAGVASIGLIAGSMPAGAQCKMATAPAFAQATAGANLGCATSESFGSPASEQAFEHGTMLWLAEWGTITVFEEGGAYEAHDDLFDPRDPPPATMAPTSPELLEPLQGFGKIWRKVGGPTAKLGWASAPEQSYIATVQYFERGAVIQRADGAAYTLAIFNHARGSWTKTGS
jgi:uncharacterized protein with LGFP repeats